MGLFVFAIILFNVAVGMGLYSAAVDEYKFQWLFGAIGAQAEQQANAAKQVSLTPQVLCQQFIQAIRDGHVSVLNTAGPCSAVPAATSSTSVIVPTR